MDKWLRQSTANTKQYQIRQDDQHPRANGRKDRDGNDKVLQQALETSRLESQKNDRYTKDLEQATWLSLRDSSLHRATLQVRPFGSASLKTVNKKRSYDDDDWAVDSFLTGFLSKSSSSITKSDKHDKPSIPPQDDATGSLADDDGDDDDATTEDKEEWEVHYNSETDELYEVPSKQTGHDDKAEAGFFGQLRRETWDMDEVRSSHAAAKKRSMADAIKKNKRIRIPVSPSSNSSGHNYYATADEVLDHDMEAAGFAESAAGLSWEGVGQTRYA